MSASARLPRGVVAAAAAGVLAAIALPLLAARLVPVAPAVDPGAPSAALAPVATTTARLPPLAPLPLFDVNDENPFVPFALRVAAKAGVPGPGSGTPAPPERIQHQPPAGTDLPLILPEARLARAGFGCVGIVAARGESSLLVRLSDGATAAVAIGEAVPTADPRARWTLEALEPGGIARFRDALGAAQRLAVGGVALVARAPERL